MLGTIARMADAAHAGHAGEAGPMTMLPHEMMGAIVGLAIIGIILVVLGLVGIWLLVRIHRQLKRGPDGASASPPAPPPSSRS